MAAETGIEMGTETVTDTDTPPPTDADAPSNVVALKGRKRKKKQGEAHDTEIEYRSDPDGLWYHHVTDKIDEWRRLSTFGARIAAHQIIDDGIEQKHEVVIAARKDADSEEVEIEAPFDDIKNTVIYARALGTDATLMAGRDTGDHFRVALQTCSGAAPRRYVYSHVGWREIDGQNHYLSASGALSQDGLNPAVRTRLDSTLQHYRVAAHPDHDPQEAFAALLSFLDVHPVAGPTAFASIGRALLGPCRVMVYFVGTTQSQKTELALAAQRAFAPALPQPPTWNTTANAAEENAFLAKDALMLIDDMVPRSRHDMELFDRFVRSIGNRAARQRLHKNGSLRQERPPRGLVVGTGEDIKAIQSARARCFVVEIQPNSMDLPTLTELADHGKRGLLATCTALMVQHLLHADNLARWRAYPLHLAKQERQREGMDGLRAPDNLAELLAGGYLCLTVAAKHGLFDADGLKSAKQRLYDALVGVTGQEVETAAAAAPEIRFLTLLRAAFNSGRCHLRDGDGNSAPQRQAAQATLDHSDTPDTPETDANTAKQWGWLAKDGFNSQRLDPQGPCIGYLVENHALLTPSLALAIVKKLADEQGEPFFYSAEALGRFLVAKGLAKKRNEHGKAVTKVTIAGKRQYFWAIEHGEI